MRPTRNDEAVLRVAAGRLVPKIMEWMEAVEPIPEDEREWMTEHLTKGLVKVLRYSSADDGYELVKRLERDLYIDGDSDLVEIMDDATWDVDDALAQAEAQWVEENGVKPNLAVGDEVDVQTFIVHDGKAIKVRSYSGIITGIDEKVGRYHVHTPEQSKTAYYLFTYEECRAKGSEWVSPV